MLARPESAAQEAGLLDLPEIRAFVAEHYAGDIALYREIAAEREAIRARLGAEGGRSRPLAG